MNENHELLPHVSLDEDCLLALNNRDTVDITTTTLACSPNVILALSSIISSGSGSKSSFDWPYQILPPQIASSHFTRAALMYVREL